MPSFLPVSLFGLHQMNCWAQGEMLCAKMKVFLANLHTLFGLDKGSPAAEMKGSALSLVVMGIYFKRRLDKEHAEKTDRLQREIREIAPKLLRKELSLTPNFFERTLSFLCLTSASLAGAAWGGSLGFVASSTGGWAFSVWAHEKVFIPCQTRPPDAEAFKADLSSYLSNFLQNDLVLSHYKCSLSGKLPEEPVLGTNGQWYDRAFLKQKGESQIALYDVYNKECTQDARVKLLILYRKIKWLNAMSKTLWGNYSEIYIELEQEYRRQAELIKTEFSLNYNRTWKECKNKVKEASCYLQFDPLPSIQKQ